MNSFLRSGIGTVVLGTACLALGHAGAQQSGDALPPQALARFGTLEMHHTGLSALAFSADGKTIYSAGDDKTIRGFEVATGKQVHAFAYPEANATFTADGRHVLLWDFTGVVRICALATGKEVAGLRAHSISKQLQFLQAPQLLADGQQLAAPYGDGILCFFDVVSPLRGPQHRRRRA